MEACIAIIWLIAPILSLAILFPTFGRPLHDLTCAVVNLDPVKDHAFINLINKETLNLILVPDIDTGIQMVLDGRAVGVMEIPVNFKNSVIERHAYPLRISDEMLNSAKISLYLDMTNLQIAFTLKAAVQEAYLNYTRIILKEKFLNEDLLSNPFISSSVFSHVAMDINEFAFPSVMMLLTFFSGLALSSIHSFYERKFGIYDRNIVAGVNPFEELICHAVVQTVFVVIQVPIMLTVAIYGFQMTCEGNVGLVIVIYALIGLWGIFYGHNVTAISESEFTCLTICYSTLLPSTLASAILWPLEAMPHGIQTLSKFLPLTLPNLALRNVFFRGITISHSCVWLGLLSSSVWIFVFILSHIFISKAKE